MSIYINSVNINLAEVVNARTVITSGNYISSISSNQITGDFIVTNPDLEGGSVIIYPQSPSNLTSALIGEAKTLKNFSGYGFLNFPIDSQMDYARNKLWITDAGNERILKVDMDSFLVDFSIASISLPHSIVPNINNGGVFIKAFTNLNSGVIYYYSSNGVLQSFFTYLDNLDGESLIPDISNPYAINFPLPSTMCFDHRRNRLWWTANEYVYMVDLSNSQIVSYDLSINGYSATRGLDIDIDSGNSFITVYGDSDRWFIIQMFRDNNAILSRCYLTEEN
jgi:hypothetical protein